CALVPDEQSLSSARRIVVAMPIRYVSRPHHEEGAMTSTELDHGVRAVRAMGRLDGMVVIVTGGASGLGRTYCESLVREGARVVVADLDHEGADAFASAINEEQETTQAVAVGADVTSERDAERIARTAIDAFQQIDMLIN